ncbi:MAG: UbiA family prenyltransferase [Defluviitaleaceae bacterium]|nr:UbiA family prenyltransferase [Defluviitaleaceae bacterium]
MSRWWQYQKERFPLAGYLPLMAMFGFSSISFSLHLYNPYASFSDIGVLQVVVAILSTTFWFMLMRIADEHKDFEEDSKFRPYRPVQRGLVKLKELRFIGAFLILAQMGMSILIDWRMLGFFALVCIWFGLMTMEFGIGKWLKKRHTIYLISHMMIMPFIELYGTAIEWLPRGGGFSIGILLFMVSSLCDGTVIEVGRKLRAPENEEYGVDTYTQIWGPKRAMVVWLVCLTISSITTTLAGFQIGVGWHIMAALLVLYIYAFFVAIKFTKKPTAKNAKIFKVLPGVWMLVMHAGLGLLSFFV